MLATHYGYLLPWIRPGTDTASTLIKVAFDQLVFAPFFLTYLFATLDRIQGKSGRDAYQNAREKLWETLKVNWMIWPLV